VYSATGIQNDPEPTVKLNLVVTAPFFFSFYSEIDLKHKTAFGGSELIKHRHPHLNDIFATEIPKDPEPTVIKCCARIECDKKMTTLRTQNTRYGSNRRAHS
jgi:hypothetical protein